MHGQASPFRKVFCVGLNKTGTSSVRRAFLRLGWEPSFSPTTQKALAQSLFRSVVRDGDCEPALRAAEGFVSFKDRPWNVREMYRRLAERFPSAAFVLTVRKPESWWESVHTWLTHEKPHMVGTYESHLGAPFSREAFLEAYLAYNNSVESFFAGSANFLKMNLAHGDGYPELCGMLGVPVIEEPFPFVNAQHERTNGRPLGGSEA